jgi:hypothetical protein
MAVTVLCATVLVSLPGDKVQRDTLFFYGYRYSFLRRPKFNQYLHFLGNADGVYSQRPYRNSFNLRYHIFILIGFISCS